MFAHRRWRLFFYNGIFLCCHCSFICRKFRRERYLSTDKNSSDTISRLNEDFLSSLKARDTAKCRLLLASILKLINGSDIDSLNRSDSYFYAGYYYLIKGSYSEAAMCLKSSYLIRYELNRRDDICAKCLYNLGVAYFNLGDYKNMEKASP